MDLQRISKAVYVELVYGVRRKYITVLRIHSSKRLTFGIVALFKNKLNLN